MNAIPPMDTDCPDWPADFAARYRAKGYWRDETFATLLDAIADAFPDRIALVEGERHLTYAGLRQRARALAAGLAGLGLGAGDRVVVQLPSGIAFAETFFACALIGAVPVLALPAHRRLEIESFCAFTAARAYIVPDRLNGFDYRPLARELLAAQDTLRHVVVVGAAEELVSFADLFPAVPPAPAPARAHDVAVFQISGGTTGVPKLIPRRHDEYIYNARTAAGLSGLGPDSVYLCALPVSHNFPLACPGILGVLMTGGRVVFAPTPDPETVFPLIARHHVTISAVVPPVALLWMQAAAAGAPDLASLAVLQVGGAKMSEEAARRVRPTLGCRLQQVFGMAEGLVCYTRLDDDEATIVSTQGRPMSPADELRVVDAEGAEVPPGAPGELLVRGPYTIRGYYRLPGHNAGAFTADGFYRTGDVVRLTADGNLVLSGREKDLINRGGEKISPEEVENLLLAHADVHDAAVVGLPDATLGERICAFVIPAGEAPRPMALARHLRGRGLAAFKMPDEFVFLGRFPETGVGKVSKKDLRAALKTLYRPASAAAGA